MTEQSGIEKTLAKTLQALVWKVGLSPAEVTQLRLSHLHLAGKSPNLAFSPEGSDRSKTVELDLETHRALVGWLVARPDSKSDFLFPGEGDEPLDPETIQQLIGSVANVQSPPEDSDPSGAEPEEMPAADAPPPSPDETILSGTRPVAAPPPAPDETMPGSFKQPPPFRPMPPPAPSRPMPPVSRPEPPPSRPEMGPLSPEMGATRVTPSRPVPTPPTAPEGDEAVNIPLPTAAPKPSGPETPETTAEESPETKSDSGPRPPAAAEAPAGPEAKLKEAAPAAGAAAAVAAGKEKMPPAAGAGAKLTAEEAAAKASDGTGAGLPRWLIYASAGVLVVLCATCLGGTFTLSQTGPGNQLLAGLGLSGGDEATTESELEALPATATPLDSPLPTPTLPPTATATLAPTDTPAPATDTPAPTTTDTPEAAATDTPAPTDTPVPTDTPIPEEPAGTPTPAESPTPAMKYAAPTLTEPEDGFRFIEGNTIVLQWEPVGELASDEQYAVRMVYRFENQPTYQGANVRETEWQVPLSLFGQVDGPDNLYEWFVVVERLNDDGSGTAISPESERRTFIWR